MQARARQLQLLLLLLTYLIRIQYYDPIAGVRLCVCAPSCRASKFAAVASRWLSDRAVSGTLRELELHHYPKSGQVRTEAEADRLAAHLVSLLMGSLEPTGATLQLSLALEGRTGLDMIASALLSVHEI